MISKIDLRDRIAENIDVKGVGMAVHSEDARVIMEAIDDEHAYLEYQADIDWFLPTDDTEDSIPRAVVRSLVNRISFNLRSNFPNTTAPEEFDLALKDIREYSAKQQSGEPTPVEYF